MQKSQKLFVGSVPYRYLAPVEAAEGRFPLVIFLHGVGECGTDNDSQLWYPFFTGENSVFSPGSLRKFPCHFVAPQAQDDDRWVNVQNWDQDPVISAVEPTSALRNVIELIEQMGKRTDVDSSRVYLIGLSMGAYGVFEIGARRPELCAAVVAVCGGADLNASDALQTIPMRIYHGNKDKVVPVKLSQDLDRLLSSKNKNFTFIELDGVGHNAWEFAFRDQTLFPWLFNQKKA